MIIVKDFLKKLQGPDRIKIVKDDKTVFTGWQADEREIPPEYLKAEMKSFRIETEIRCKDWKARGLLPPLQPEQTPDYSFSDLEMKLYYKICI